MSTKYVLHGGKAQTPSAENDKFFREILKDAPEYPKILLVHFASSPEKSQANREKDVAQFSRVKGAGQMSLEVAKESTFLAQVKKADIVYFGGGTTVKLLETVKQFDSLKESFEGKTIAGESAGMNFLSEYCFSKSGGGIMKCLGLIPFKTIPHYSEEYKEAKNELDNISGNSQTLALPEFEYFVYEVD